MLGSAGSIDPRMNTRDRLLDRNMGARIGKGFLNLCLYECIQLRPFRWKERKQAEINRRGLCSTGRHIDIAIIRGGQCQPLLFAAFAPSREIKFEL